jgi:hypothetical protein
MRARQARQPSSGFDASPREQEIVSALMRGELHWELRRGIEMALFRTFGSPRISDILASTGKSVGRPEARRAGTEQIIHAMLEHGYSSPKGAAALDSMNRIHARFVIDNEDHLYVLSTLVLEPIRWASDFGWRAFTREEADAYHSTWKGIAGRMGIRDVPETVGDFDAWSRAYEDRWFAPHAASARIAAAVSEMYVSEFPAPLRPAARHGVRALLDAPLLRATGMRPTNRMSRLAVRGALETRALLVRAARAFARLVEGGCSSGGSSGVEDTDP